MAYKWRTSKRGAKYRYNKYGNKVYKPKSRRNRMIPSADGYGPSPSYLRIPNWKSCLGEKNMGTWRANCLPSSRPEACPEASWERIRRYKPFAENPC